MIIKHLIYSISWHRRLIIITHDASVRRMHKESPLQNPCMRCLYQAIICLINSKHAQWLHKSAIDAEISVARAGQGCRIDEELSVRVPLPWFMWAVNMSRGRDSGVECAVTILLAGDHTSGLEANGAAPQIRWPQVLLSLMALQDRTLSTILGATPRLRHDKKFYLRCDPDTSYPVDLTVSGACGDMKM